LKPAVHLKLSYSLNQIDTVNHNKSLGSDLGNARAPRNESCDNCIILNFGSFGVQQHISLMPLVGRWQDDDVTNLLQQLSRLHGARGQQISWFLHAIAWAPGLMWRN